MLIVEGGNDIKAVTCGIDACLQESEIKLCGIGGFLNEMHHDGFGG